MFKRRGSVFHVLETVKLSVAVRIRHIVVGRRHVTHYFEKFLRREVESHGSYHRADGLCIHKVGNEVHGDKPAYRLYGVVYRGVYLRQEVAAGGLRAGERKHAVHYAEHLIHILRRRGIDHYARLAVLRAGIYGRGEVNFFGQNRRRRFYAERGYSAELFRNRLNRAAQGNFNGRAYAGIRPVYGIARRHRHLRKADDIGKIDFPFLLHLRKGIHAGKRRLQNFIQERRYLRSAQIHLARFRGDFFKRIPVEFQIVQKVVERLASRGLLFPGGGAFFRHGVRGYTAVERGKRRFHALFTVVSAAVEQIYGYLRQIEVIPVVRGHTQGVHHPVVKIVEVFVVVRLGNYGIIRLVNVGQHVQPLE